MKKSVLCFVGAMCLTLTTIKAQITTGVVVYDMEMTSDNEQMQAQLDMMSGGKIVLTFDNESFKQEMSNPMMIRKTIYNSKESKGLLLNEMMGMKSAVNMTEEEFDSMMNEEKGKEGEADVKVIKMDEMKEIAGYQCSKVIVRTENSETTMFITKEIKLNSTKNQFASKEVEGFPMWIETKTVNNGMPMTITMTASSVKDGIKEKAPFELTVPKGYKTQSYDEYSKMMKGYRGGN